MSETPEDLLRRVIDDDPRKPGGSDSLTDLFSQRFNRSQNIVTIATVVQLCLSIVIMVTGLWLLVEARELRPALMALFVMLVGFETTILVKLWYWVSVTRLSLAKDSKLIQLLFSRAFPATESESGGTRAYPGEESRAPSFLNTARSRGLNWTLRITMLVATACLVWAFVMGAQRINDGGLALAGTGKAEQSDEWTFDEGDQVTAVSQLKFACVGVPVVRLTLPYANGVVKSVTFCGRPAAATRLNWREYEVEIPVLPFKEPAPAMEVRWQFPITELYQDAPENGGLRTRLRSFVPVSRYELFVVVKPESTFTSCDGRFKDKWLPFRATPKSAQREFGSCGLSLVPKNPA